MIKNLPYERPYFSPGSKRLEPDSKYSDLIGTMSAFNSEQPWPSGNALDSDQHGPGLEAQRSPLVTSGRASGPKCSCQN